MYLHEDDVEGGEGGGQPDDVEDGGDHLGFGFLDDSHNGKSIAANPIQQPCQTVKSLTLSRIQYEYRKKRKHPLQQCKDSLHALFFTIDLRFAAAKIQKFTSLQVPYSFFNASAGFVFAARSVCQRTEKSENVIFFQIEYLKM